MRFFNFLKPKKRKQTIINGSDFNLIREVGRDFDYYERQEIINQSAKEASKVLYTAFHVANLESHIDATLDFSGQKFRLKFEKIDPLV